MDRPGDQEKDIRQAAHAGVVGLGVSVSHSGSACSALGGLHLVVGPSCELQPAYADA